MTFSPTSALVLMTGLALTSLSLVACSSSSDPSPSVSVSAEAAESQAPADAMTQGGTSYCDPLAAAYEIKPPSGEIASDEELVAFGEALLPVADAASVDGQQDLADMFTLLAKVNSDPDNTTDAETGESLQMVIANSEQVNADCGIDLLA